METGEIVGKLLPLLFNMMGPIGLMPVFAAVTARMDQPARNAVALRATLFSITAVILAVFVGEGILKGWGINNASLIVAAGLILTLSAIRSILLPAANPVPNGQDTPDPKGVAVRPVAFPTIISPQGVGVVIIFAAFLPSIEAKSVVLGVAAFIILIDFGAMRIAHWFMAKVGMVPLMILGAVFGVLQVALGVEMIADGLKLFGRP